MTISLYIAEHCETCVTVQNKLLKLFKNNIDYEINVFDINKNNTCNVKIVPALFVGDLLYSYGEFDYTKFEARLNSGYFEEGIGKIAS